MSTSLPPEPLSTAQIACLACIAGHMIPASAEYTVPGADDPVIMADMTASLDRDRAELRRVLDLVDQQARGPLAALPRQDQGALLGQMRADAPATLAVVEAVVSRAYYRDPRVLAALGLEPRAPFPKGFDVPDGDWSLLDPVKARGPIWRPA